MWIQIFLPADSLFFEPSLDTETFGSAGTNTTVPDFRLKFIKKKYRFKRKLVYTKLQK